MECLPPKENPPAPELASAEARWEAIQAQFQTPAFPPPVNSLLHGGLLPGLIYLFTVPRRMATPLTLHTTANFYYTYAAHYGSPEGCEIYCVDTLNRFDPYFLTSHASAPGYPSADILSRLQLMRAFSWPSLVGGLEQQVAALPPLPATRARLYVFNYLFGDFEGVLQDDQRGGGQAYRDVKKMAATIQKLAVENALIVITGPLNSHSQAKPAGGTIISHLAHVHIRLEKRKKFHIYHLDQHPFLPAASIAVPLEVPRKKKTQLAPRSFHHSHKSHAFERYQPVGLERYFKKKLDTGD